MKRMIITGINGLIGRATAQAALASGFTVLGAGLSSTCVLPGIPYLCWDMTGSDADLALSDFAQGADICLHLAACVDINDQRALPVNVNGTFNALKAAKTAGCKRFVHLSSIPIVGKPKAVIDENTPAAPRTPYHVSKYTAELLTYLPEFSSMQPVNLRIAAPIGPGMPANRFIPTLLARGRQGVIPLYGKGERVQDYIDVRDVARALLFACDKGSGLYLLHGHACSNKEMAMLCAAFTGGKVVYSDVEDPADDERWYIDDSRARNEWNYSPQYTLCDSVEAISAAITTL